ncbi:MAG: hypothetical protein WCL44_09370 [bacterium]
MIYDLLRDCRPGLLGPGHWMSNLRWMVEELDRAGGFAFRTCPLDADEQELGGMDNASPAARRTLFGLKVALAGEVDACEYRPDGLSARAAGVRLDVLLPLERYGVILELHGGGDAAGAGLEFLTSHAAGRRPVRPQHVVLQPDGEGGAVWSDGAYTLAFRFRGTAGGSDADGFTLRPDPDGVLRVVVAFHPDAQRALEEAASLWGGEEAVRESSRAAWEAYLASCPVCAVSSAYTWQSQQGPVTHSPDEILARQYWHWHCLLSNVYQLPFNRLKAFIAPDKPSWLGCWSNDGPESLRALAHTGRHALARECLTEYVRAAITVEGDLGWYLHGTGECCLERPGDVGRFSHGVPTIVSAVAGYVSATGDAGILDAPAGPGGTVWEKLSRYMRVVYDRRDLDGDGLIEWSNLWEGGADDEVGPFFSRATLEEWVTAVLKLPGAELEAFFARNRCPVTNLYEQAFFLRALESLEELARRRGDAETAAYARGRMDATCRILEERHWDEQDGFYYDWDVRAGRLSRVKNQDAFYLPRYLRNRDRVARLMAHLDDPREFGLRYTPTLALNESGFRPKGYWSGGYWPREACYIAESLVAHGYRERALELLVKAVCAATGKIIPETLDPLTGVANTVVTGMAYNTLDAMLFARVAVASGLGRWNPAGDTRPIAGCEGIPAPDGP